MAGTIQCGRRSRKDFGKIPSIVEIPNLIEVQKRSYETFLQKDVPADRREEIGLQAVFKSVFPIADYNDNALLEFDSYHFGDPKYTVEECHDRGMTFAIPLKVTLRLVVFDHDKEAKTRTIREQRGQEVYLGELPLMTDKGTFIINGTERVVVSRRVAPFKLLVMTAGKVDASMYETLARDHVKNPDEALVEIYRKLRPGDPPTVESARALFRGMFMDARRYDLARVGRFMINKKLQIDAPLGNKTLRSEDIVSVVRHLLMVKLGSKPTDDIDHLGNRRVRSVGELLENQFRVGLTRMERAVKERMSISDTANLMPHD